MTMPAGRIVAALLLPPLAAYLESGPGRDFLLSCVLTLLAFIPGLVFAMWLVLRRTPSPAAAGLGSAA